MQHLSPVHKPLISWCPFIWTIGTVI